MKSIDTRSAARIALLYAITAAAWILLSDFLVSIFAPGPAVLDALQAAKGLTFVIVTAGILYVLLKREFDSRWRAEKELFNSQMMYRELAESITDVFFALDRDLRFTYWNKASEELTSIPAEQALGKLIFELFPELDGTGMVDLYRSVIEAQKPGSTRTDFSLNGRDYVFAVEVYPTRQGVAVFGKNITEYQRAIEAIRVSEEHNRIFAQMTSDYIYIMRINAKGEPELEWVSDSFIRLIGYTSEEIKSLGGPLVIAYPEDLPKYQANFLRVLSGEAVDSEVRAVRKNGEIFWVRNFSQPKWDAEHQRVVSIYGAAQDITKRKLSEQALERSEERFRLLYEQAPISYQSLDEEARFVQVNKAWLEKMGYTREEVLGRWFGDFMTPESANKLKVAFPRFVRQGETSATEFEMVRNDGSVFLASFEGKISRDVSGKFQQTHCIFEDVTERRQRERELEAIAGVSLSLRNTPTSSHLLPVLLEHTMDILHGQGSAVVMQNKDEGKTWIEMGWGDLAEISGLELETSASMSGLIISTGQPYHTEDILADTQSIYGQYFERSPAMVGVPLIAQGKTIGALLVNRKQPFSDNEIHILSTIGDLAASTFRRITLYENLKKINERLNRSYDETIEGWSRALDLRDHETEGHTQRVTELTLRLAKTLGVDEKELVQIRRGSLLHDIGKMAIPDSILHKPGPLSDEDWAIMRQHPSYAYSILSPIDHLRPALAIPYTHHEKWDGSGYPHGLKAEEIPLSARIFALADVWDALRSDRPYRRAWGFEQAAEYIKEQAGRHFDPELVPVMLEDVIHAE